MEQFSLFSSLGGFVYKQLYNVHVRIILQPAREYMQTSHSTLLDHVTEVVYLVKQIDLTKKTEAALQELDTGNKESIQVREG